MDVKEVDILGETISTHWYYHSKARAMAKLLGDRRIKRILDIGAGSGFFSRYLLSKSNAAEAWCVDIGYKKDSDSSEAKKPIHFRKSIDFIDVDTVLLMDVLEHVNDDVYLLKEYKNKVPHGTRFLISVPAFQFIWSEHDIFLEHKRRYKLTDIEHVIEHAGLRVTHGVYYFGSVFPIAVTTRLSKEIFKQKIKSPQSQLKKHNPIVNTFLKFLCKMELPLLKYNRLVGLTVFCLAEA